MHSNSYVVTKASTSGSDHQVSEEDDPEVDEWARRSSWGGELCSIEAKEGRAQCQESVWEAQRHEGASHFWHGGGTVHPLSSDWVGLRRKRKAQLRVVSWGKRRASSVCGTPPIPFSYKLIEIGKGVGRGLGIARLGFTMV